MRSMLVALPLLLLMAFAAEAQTPEEFYRGRTITLSIGYAPGGGYDTYARLFARYFGRHVPGRPAVTGGAAGVWWNPLASRESSADG